MTPPCDEAVRWNFDRTRSQNLRRGRRCAGNVPRRMHVCMLSCDAAATEARTASVWLESCRVPSCRSYRRAAVPCGPVGTAEVSVSWPRSREPRIPCAVSTCASSDAELRFGAASHRFCAAREGFFFHLTLLPNEQSGLRLACGQRAGVAAASRWRGGAVRHKTSPKPVQGQLYVGSAPVRRHVGKHKSELR